MMEIPLTQGKVAIVDDCDFEEISKHKWRYKKGYAVRNYRSNGKRFFLCMHRVILRTPTGMQTDHINGNGLDNRRSNLRVCTNSENQRNRGATKNSSSHYKGVLWNARLGKWKARIRVNKEETYLGLFDNVTDAAKAYDRAAKNLHGEFARLNFEGNS